MERKKVKTWRLVLHIIAILCLVLYVVMHALPFTKTKLTGEDVYTGFELVFGKTVSSLVGDIKLVELSATNILFDIFVPVFYIIELLLAFKKKTKKMKRFLKLSFLVPLALGAWTYCDITYFSKKYTQFSIQLSAMTFGKGAILAIVFCAISTICLFLMTFVFKEKEEENKQEKKAEEKE